MNIRAASFFGMLLLSALASAEPVSLFDGKSLDGWEGDTRWWRVAEGVITGGSRTQEIPHNMFLATRQSYKDFELRLKIHLSGTAGVINSGIQIRSVRDPKSPEMIGYQVDAGNDFWGAGIDLWGVLYDESRRNKILAKPADVNVVTAAVRANGWNEYRIRAEGRRIRAWINGVPTIDYTEQDEKIPQQGFIGLQIHGGGTSVVQFKDLFIEPL